MDEKEQTSEFGKGLVICLVKFSEHIMLWQGIKEDFKQIREQEGQTKQMLEKLEGKESLFSESEAVKLFFNGASDHLYEIQVPRQWKDTVIEAKVRELQDLGIRIGHGFHNNEKYSESDVMRASDLCREIALLIDKKLGLDADLGKW